MLAKATGWSESFIIWQLPLVRLLAYDNARVVLRQAHALASAEA